MQSTNSEYGSPYLATLHFLFFFFPYRYIVKPVISSKWSELCNVHSFYSSILSQYVNKCLTQSYKKHLSWYGVQKMRTAKVSLAIKEQLWAIKCTSELFWPTYHHGYIRWRSVNRNSRHWTQACVARQECLGPFQKLSETCKRKMF